MPCSTAACDWAAPTRDTLRRGMAVGLALATIAAVAGAVVAVGNPFSFASERFDEFRSLETTAPGESRLTFGGGQRADLWRVALDEFADQPLTGGGWRAVTRSLLRGAPHGPQPFESTQRRLQRHPRSSAWSGFCAYVLSAARGPRSSVAGAARIHPRAGGLLRCLRPQLWASGRPPLIGSG